MTIKTKDKHVLVLGNIRCPHQYLSDAGYDISWLCKRTEGYMHAIEDNDRCINIFSYDNDDAEFLIQISKTINRKHKIDAVAAFHDASQIRASQIASALGLEFSQDPEVVKVTRDKKLTREILRKQELSSINSSVVQSDEDVRLFFENNARTNKVVLKPVDGTGSERVVAISRKESTVELRDKLGDRIVYPTLVETFFEGREFSVEAFTCSSNHHIIAITEKFKHQETFMELGHLVPARVSAEESGRIHGFVKSCLDALGFTFGVSHTEVLINDECIEMIETHTRVGGDSISDLVRFTTGIDFYELQMLESLGITPSTEKLTPQPATVFACIQYGLEEPSAKKIVRVTGLKEVKKWPEVKEASVSFGPGELIPPVRNSFDRPKSVMVVAESSERAIEIATSGLEHIEFVFDQEPN